MVLMPCERRILPRHNASGRTYPMLLVLGTNIKSNSTGEGEHGQVGAS